MKTLKITALFVLFISFAGLANADLISSAQLTVTKISTERIIAAQTADYQKFKESGSGFVDRVGAWWVNWKINSKAKSIVSYIEKVEGQEISTDRMEAVSTDHKQLIEMRENFVKKYSKSFFKTVY